MKRFFTIVLASTFLTCVGLFGDDWWGDTPSPSDLHMSDQDAALYYGFLGIVCAWAFVHHYRSF